MKAIACSLIAMMLSTSATAGPPKVDAVQNATQAIHIAKKFCSVTGPDSDWTATFTAGVWTVRQRQLEPQTTDSYVTEYIRASDGAGGRCESGPLPPKNSN
jgi:hypothetical protein